MNVSQKGIDLHCHTTAATSMYSLLMASKVNLVLGVTLTETQRQN